MSSVPFPRIACLSGLRFLSPAFNHRFPFFYSTQPPTEQSVCCPLKLLDSFG